METNAKIAQQDTAPRQIKDIRIEGPTAAGKFFVCDIQNNVWDGESWRSFGMAKFMSHKEAFSECFRIASEEHSLIQLELPFTTTNERKNDE